MPSSSPRSYAFLLLVYWQAMAICSWMWSVSCYKPISKLHTSLHFEEINVLLMNPTSACSLSSFSNSIRIFICVLTSRYWYVFMHTMYNAYRNIFYFFCAFSKIIISGLILVVKTIIEINKLIKPLELIRGWDGT